MDITSPYRAYKEELRGYYLPSEQFLTPIGKKSNLYYLIGYDKARHSQPKIMNILPVVLQFEDDIESYPELWTQKDIRAVAEEVFKWQELPNHTKEKQFYKKYISPKRLKPSHLARFEQVSLPMSKCFFDNVNDFRIVANGKLSLVYRRIGQTEQHLADAYAVVSYTEFEDGTVAHEAVSTMFISDEDKTSFRPNVPELGKFAALASLDNPRTVLTLNKGGLARFKQKTVEYEAYNLDGCQNMNITEKVGYEGNDRLAVRKFLDSMIITAVVDDVQLSLFLSEALDPSIKKITYKNGKYSTHIFGSSRRALGEEILNYNCAFQLPNYSSTIAKVFSPYFAKDNCFVLSKKILADIGVKTNP